MLTRFCETKFAGMDSQNLDYSHFALISDFAVQEELGKQNSKYIVSGKLHIYIFVII